MSNTPIPIKVTLDLTAAPGQELVIIPMKPPAERGETTITWTPLAGSLDFHFSDLQPCALFKSIDITDYKITADYVNTATGDHDYILSVTYGGKTYSRGSLVGSDHIVNASGPTIKNR